MGTEPRLLPPIGSYDELFQEIARLVQSGMISPGSGAQITSTIKEFSNLNPDYDPDKVAHNLKEKLAGGGPAIQDAGLALAVGICIGVMLRSRF
ncbi:MAG: hypothetical protein CML01_09345 [Pseudomonas sp.]|nr:hypothetical protein [Pseudomonas sp.]